MPLTLNFHFRLRVAAFEFSSIDPFSFLPFSLLVFYSVFSDVPSGVLRLPYPRLQCFPRRALQKSCIPSISSPVETVSGRDS